VRNNVIWDFMSGTEVQQAARANVVNNYYYSSRAYSPAHAIKVDLATSEAYVSGNYSQNGWDINRGNRAVAFDADVPATTDAVTAAREVLARAGARGARFGLDQTDQDYIGRITLTALHAEGAGLDK
jgi:hypothetical protein